MYEQNVVALSPPAEALGADVVLRTLERDGVEVCFGLPGGAILPIYDAIARGTEIRHVLARHEQGAGHMAEGYARASGRVGVVFATSGPGATNLVTPIANARMDSTPLLCVTGQVRSSLIGTDAFQECDIVSVVTPLVKRAWQVADVADLAETLEEALRTAREGRPGPVLVDIPRDVQEAVAPPGAGAVRPPGTRQLNGAAAANAPQPPSPASEEATTAVARALEAASRPILYVGGGVINADVSAELLALAERAQVPVVTTLMGKGALPESHPLCFGCPGMHGSKWANWGLNLADLVVAVAARFDDRVTGRLDEFAPAAKVAHFDIDPREIGKLRHADLPVLGPLRQALADTTAALHAPAPSGEWLRQLRDWRQRFPLRYDEAASELQPQRVLEVLDEVMREEPEVVWTTGVGQHQMWAMQYLRCERPRSFVTSGGLGTMGFGLPAAIGACVARPAATVVCVDGDGSFQMTPQELAAAVAERLPVIVVVLDNGGHGMVRQWQRMFYEGRLSSVQLEGPADCAAIARGFGATSFRVDSEADLRVALAAALGALGPTVIDVKVPESPVFPMIQPGSAAVDVLEYGR
jgi:acetolactate synthase I/II/III large subunit